MNFSRNILLMIFILACSRTQLQAQAQEFVVHSTALEEGAPLTEVHVYDGFGCTGGNISPDLRWSGAPQGTKSFAVTVYDPDAPTGSGWWHWLVYNIPADATELVLNAGSQSEELLPEGAVQGRSDFGLFAFGGACPPEGHGDHRYVFTVFALNTVAIDVPRDASAAMIGFMLNANVLAKAEITATFGR